MGRAAAAAASTGGYGEQALRTARHPQEPGALVALESLGNTRRGHDPHPGVEVLVGQAPPRPALPADATQEPPDGAGRAPAPQDEGAGQIGR